MKKNVCKVVFMSIVCVIMIVATIMTSIDFGGSSATAKADYISPTGIRYRTSYADEDVKRAAAKYERLESQLALYKFEHKYDCLTKEKNEKIKTYIEHSKAVLVFAASAIKDIANGGDFDTAALINNLTDTICACIAAWVPWGTLVAGVLQIAKGLFSFFMGGSEPTSEMAQMEDRLMQELNKLSDQVAAVEQGLKDLSKDVAAASDRTIEAISDKIDKTIAYEHVREFKLKTGLDDFSYREFANYLYGNTDSTKAYCDLLKTAQRENADDLVQKYYYDLVYSTLKNQGDVFYGYLIPDDDKSIIRDYYDMISARPEVENAEFEAIRFAYDLYQTALATDMQLLSCNYYQQTRLYSAWVEEHRQEASFSPASFWDEGSAINTFYAFESGMGNKISLTQINSVAEAIYSREEALLSQLAKDIAYIVGTNGSYTIGSNGEYYEVKRDAKADFGNVGYGTTVYLNAIPEGIFGLFEDLHRSDFSYSFSGSVRQEPGDNAIFTTRNGDQIIEAAFTYKGQDLDQRITFASRAEHSAFFGGNGSADDPYLIGNQTQFCRIGEDVTKHYRLVSDVTVTKGSTPFGVSINTNGHEVIEEFSGSLDGNGFTVTGLSVRGTGDNAGLFGTIGVAGSVRDLTLKDAKVAVTLKAATQTVSRFYAGCLAGRNFGEITDCRLENCELTFELENKLPNREIHAYAGGLVGMNRRFISSCSVNCKVSAMSDHYFGGDSTVQNKHYVYAGGLCGENVGEVCYSLLSQAEVSAVATSHLSPNTTVNPYVESYAGLYFGAADKDVSRAVALSNEGSSSNARGEISLYDSNWGSHYRNRKQSEQNALIGQPLEEGKEEDILESIGVDSLKTKLAGLAIERGTLSCDAEASSLSYTIEKDAAENAFHTDGLTVYYDGAKVDAFTVLRIYNWDPYNTLEEEVAQRVKLFLVATVGEQMVYGIVTIDNVTIDANQFEYVMSDISDSVRAGTTYSFANASLKKDYWVGADTAEPFNAADISVEGSFTPIGGVAEPITEITTGRLGKYVVTVYWKGWHKPVAENVEISVVCEYNFAKNPDKFKIMEGKGTPGDCKTVRETWYQCERCGEIYVQYAEKGAHRWEVTSDAAVTCASDGLKEEVCSVCGKIKVTTTPKLRHNYANPDEDYHYCTLCGNREVHQYVIKESAVDGFFTYKYVCSECGQEKEVKDTNTVVDGATMVYISDVYATHGGEEVKVYVSLKNNPGIDGAVFGIRYSESLQYVSAEEGPLFTDVYGSIREVNYGLNCSWVSGNSIKAKNENDLIVLLVLTFKLPESVSVGDAFEVQLTYGDIPRADDTKTRCGFLYKGKMQTYVAKTGVIRVVEEGRLPGDVDQNGKVDLFDAFYALIYYNGGGVVVDYRVADVTADRDVQLDDAQRLLRYFSGSEDLLATEYEVVLNGNCDGLPNEKIIVNLYEDYKANNDFKAGRYPALPTLTREGHEFLGWFTRREGGKAVKAGDEVEYDRSQLVQTLYAHWQNNYLTLSVDGQEENIAYSGVVVTLPTPQKTMTKVRIYDGGSEDSAYPNLFVVPEFDYWSMDQDGGSRYSGNTFDFANGGLTLYANWRYYFTDNGHEIDLAEIAAFSKRGYYTQADELLYKTAEYKNTIKSAQEVYKLNTLTDEEEGNSYKRIFVKYQPIEFSIAFDLKYGTYDLRNVENGLFSIEKPYKLVSSNNVKKTGYEFVRFAVKVGNTEIYSIAKADFASEFELGYIDGIKHGDSITLAAEWTANKYTVTFVSDKNVKQTKEVTYGVEYGTLPTIQKTGYTFNGWYTKESNDSKVTSSTLVSTACDHTLYAHWTPKTYTISFNANGGVCTTASTTVTYDAPYGSGTAGSLPMPTRACYSFDGWYTTAASGGSKIENDTVVTQASAGTLYARWTAIVQSELMTSTFTAMVKTESTKQGRGEFTITGIPVIYEGEVYIYGNAYYEGKISGGSYFGDVGRMSLILDGTTALFGGLLSWSGETGNSNKSGTEAWDPTYPHNTNELSYLHKNAYDDFAGNETVKITINGICVKVGAPTKDKALYPEMIKSSFDTDIYSEETKQGRVKFDVYGIKVSYKNSGYIYGCAYYNGKIGGTKMINVAQIQFKNTSREILNGGVMLYRGIYDYVHNCGLYSSADFKVNGSICQYMAENGDNDFAGADNVTISITNICFKISDTIESPNAYLPLVEKSFYANVYAETQYEDYIKFSALGVQVKYNNKTGLLGYAYFKGKIEGNRLNDCDRVVLLLDEKIAIQGGYLHYTGNYDDWNTQAVLSSYSNGLTTKLTFYGDNCADDFPGKDASETTIYINGICILLSA